MLSEAFRPETFDQIIGHTEAKKQLTEYLTANPRGVAFLILGTAGIGKTTLALTAARTFGYEPLEIMILADIEDLRFDAARGLLGETRARFPRESLRWDALAQRIPPAGP